MQRMRNRSSIMSVVVFGLALMMSPHYGWALKNDVALVLARTGAVIQCGNNALLLGNEIRTIPQGLLVMDAKISEYVQQVVGGTRGLQAVTAMDIAVIKHRKTPLPAIWLLCDLDNIDDPGVLEEFLHTSKRDHDQRCSVKNFDNETLQDRRLIGYLSDSHHTTTGTVTVRDSDTQGIITIMKEDHRKQSNDAEKIVILVGDNGTTIDPQSRCNSGEVPVVQPIPKK